METQARTALGSLYGVIMKDQEQLAVETKLDKLNNSMSSYQDLSVLCNYQLPFQGNCLD